MKKHSDERLEKANKVTKQELIEKIKSKNPVRFDQVLIGSEHRQKYYYVDYRSLAFSRNAAIIAFPLFNDVKQGFKDIFLSKGSSETPILLEEKGLIEKFKALSRSPVENPKFSSVKKPFSELKLKLTGTDVSDEQPYYYIPAQTEITTCYECDGDKYVTCNEPECRGQHIYDCSECHAKGEVVCSKCRGKGEANCSKCSGVGDVKCSTCSGKGRRNCVGCGGHGKRWTGKSQTICTRCNGSGYDTCTDCHGNGRNRCTKCVGRGVIKCETCHAKGTVTCDNCRGKGQITCRKCYGDHKDDRYGKIDCWVCETAGELGHIAYIETEVNSYNDKFIFSEEEGTISCDVRTFSGHYKTDQPLETTYNSIEQKIKENYDDHSTICSHEGMERSDFKKDDYPLLLTEEIYYEAIPCVTFNYDHILSATQHQVSVLGIDQQREVLYHSNPTATPQEKESKKEKFKELCRKAFSTKAYKDKIDRRNEMLLMIHMAKADGVIEEKEKKYLAGVITGLEGFTNSEKSHLFSLMSRQDLPLIKMEDAIFSTVQRGNLAKQKIVELVAKADLDYEPIERAKLEEITKAIEIAQKSKSSWLMNFLKTWQVSLSVFILIALISYLIYLFGVAIPAHFERKAAEKQAIKEAKLKAEAQAIAEKHQKAFPIIVGVWQGKSKGKKIVVEIENMIGDTLVGSITIGNDKRRLTGNIDIYEHEYDCEVMYRASLEELEGEHVLCKVTVEFVGREDTIDAESGKACKGNFHPVESEGSYTIYEGDKEGEFKLTKKK